MRVDFPASRFGLTIASLLVSLAGCAGPQPGEDRLVTETLEHDEIAREYLLYVPTAKPAPEERRPLLLVLHGGGGTARAMVHLTYGRFNQLADEHGFYVVYPQGIDKSWNDGRPDVDTAAHARGIDDVGFLESLIDHVQASYPIDPQRVFSTGISNGGLMSLRLGCALPYRIRAIAPVTASLPPSVRDACRTDGAVGLALINGTDDPLVPYDGGQIRVFGKNRGTVLSTQETISFWVSRNRCDRSVNVQEWVGVVRDDGTRVRRIGYSGCRDGADVVLFRVDGGGHTWPGGHQYLGEWLVGRTSRDINACDEIWSFFAAFP